MIQKVSVSIEADEVDLLGILNSIANSIQPSAVDLVDADDIAEPAVGMIPDAPPDTAPDPTDPVDVKQVCPFTIVVDTREQAPFHFVNIDPFSVVPLRTDTSLKTGDYSIVGLESRLTIERKSISDFLGSITADRQRFEAEIARMAEMQRQAQERGELSFCCVVVEGELSDVLRHSRGKTQVQTDSILGTVDAWSMRYGVHWRFCVGGRRGAEIQTLRLLHQFWRQERHRVREEREGKA